MKIKMKNIIKDKGLKSSLSRVASIMLPVMSLPLYAAGQHIETNEYQASICEELYDCPFRHHVVEIRSQDLKQHQYSGSGDDKPAPVYADFFADCLEIDDRDVYSFSIFYPYSDSGFTATTVNGFEGAERLAQVNEDELDQARVSSSNVITSNLELNTISVVGRMPATTLSGGNSNTKEDIYWLADQLRNDGVVVVAVTAEDYWFFDARASYRQAHKAGSCIIDKLNAVVADDDNNGIPNGLDFGNDYDNRLGKLKKSLQGNIGKKSLIGYSAGGAGALWAASCLSNDESDNHGACYNANKEIDTVIGLSPFGSVIDGEYEPLNFLSNISVPTLLQRPGQDNTTLRSDVYMQFRTLPSGIEKVFSEVSKASADSVVGLDEDGSDKDNHYYYSGNVITDVTVADNHVGKNYIASWLHRYTGVTGSGFMPLLPSNNSVTNDVWINLCRTIDDLTGQEHYCNEWYNWYDGEVLELMTDPDANPLNAISF